MTHRTNAVALGTALRLVKVGRLAVLLAAAVAAGLLMDWVRRDRVFFQKDLPEFKTVPAEP